MVNASHMMGSVCVDVSLHAQRERTRKQNLLVDTKRQISVLEQA